MILGGNTPDPAVVAILSKSTEKLATPVTINGESFDGSANVTIPVAGTSDDVAEGAVHKYFTDARAIAAVATGLSTTITTAKLTPGGANGSMTFTGGILTAQTQAT